MMRGVYILYVVKTACNYNWCSQQPDSLQTSNNTTKAQYFSSPLHAILPQPSPSYCTPHDHHPTTYTPLYPPHTSLDSLIPNWDQPVWDQQLNSSSIYTYKNMCVCISDEHGIKAHCPHKQYELQGHKCITTYQHPQHNRVSQNEHSITTLNSHTKHPGNNIVSKGAPKLRVIKSSL